MEAVPQGLVEATRELRQTLVVVVVVMTVGGPGCWVLDGSTEAMGHLMVRLLLIGVPVQCHWRW